MVDSINGAGSPSVKQIYINWKELTAKEVIKKEKEGQTAPPEILKWAEELAKMVNAPDDVTYDVAKGETDIDRLNELVNTQVAQNAQQTQEAENPEQGNPNQDNPKKTEEQNGAQQFRQGLADSGVDLRSQGKILTTTSTNAQAETIAMINNAETSAQTAANMNATADSLTEKTVSDTETTKQEYDRLMGRSKSENDPLTREERTRLVSLGQELGKIGTAAQQELTNLSGQVQALANTVNQSGTIAQNATNYGVETTDVGLQLMGKDEAKRGETNQQLTSGNTDSSAGKTIQDAIGRINIFKLIFNADYRTGLLAAKQGGATIDTASIGNASAASATSQIETSSQNIQNNKQKIETATNAKSQAETPSTTQNEDTKEAEQATLEQDNLTLADESLTTDANEIIKRKERKGLA